MKVTVTVRGFDVKRLIYIGDKRYKLLTVEEKRDYEAMVAYYGEIVCFGIASGKDPGYK